MKSPNKPTSQTEEVLYYLITRISIDRKQMMISCNVLNLPDQILRLRTRYGLKITRKKITVTNKFKREVEYSKYSIEDKKTASRIYKQMQEINLFSKRK